MTPPRAQVGREGLGRVHGATRCVDAGPQRRSDAPRCRRVNGGKISRELFDDRLCVRTRLHAGFRVGKLSLQFGDPRFEFGDARIRLPASHRD